jgi:hypothetical protein
MEHNLSVWKESIIGAVARGWTHPSNSHKTMDVDLAMAIVVEIEKLFEILGNTP